MRPSCSQYGQHRNTTPTKSALWIGDDHSLCDISQMLGKRD